ncbi:hypothetical protein EK904_011955 [Melospiza melodia maxima]|nr:hypothetical protein EK904_011955 [Melospiza melodia maxima]
MRDRDAAAGGAVGAGAAPAQRQRAPVSLRRRKGFRPRILSHIDVKLLNQKLLFPRASKEMRFLERASSSSPRHLTVELLSLLAGPSLPGMDCGHSAESSEEISSPGAEPDSSAGSSTCCPPLAAAPRAGVSVLCLSPLLQKWPMRSRLYIGATGQFLTHSAQGDSANHGETSTSSQI